MASWEDYYAAEAAAGAIREGEATDWASVGKTALGGLSQIGNRPAYQDMVPAQSMRLSPPPPPQAQQPGGAPMPLRQMAPGQPTAMMQNAAQNLIRRDGGPSETTGLGGALGTALGALAGSFIPGVGTALGGTLGGALGSALD
jgi:hypothetical protein